MIKENIEYYEIVLERLHDYREGWQLSKAEMARKLGIDRSLYSRFERGKKAVTYPVLMKMHDLGIDIDYLVTGIKSKETKLSEMYDKCKLERRSSFVNIVTSYMNVFMEKDNSKAIYCRKEMEILNFNIEKMNGQRTGTVWSCIREIHGLTQEQVRAVLDINIKTYRKMEKGQAMPTLEMLVNLYQKLGYYPSLLHEINSNYILMLNNAWDELSDEDRKTMEKIASKTLKDLNSI